MNQAYEKILHLSKEIASSILVKPCVCVVKMTPEKNVK